MTFLDRFVDYYAARLLANDDGRSYLLGRGSSEDQWVRHRLGYVDEVFLPDPVDDPGHTEACETSPQCESCKFIAWTGGFDRFKLLDRIIYPITTYSGNVCGFTTRSTKEKVYDSFVLSRRPESYFFLTSSSMPSIWRSRTVVLTEGPSDALVVERLTGLPTLGVLTNTLNRSQSRFIDRFADTIVLILDNDAAGRDGTQKILRSFSTSKAVIDARHSNHPAKDPADLWRAIGDLKCKKAWQENLPPQLRR